MADEFESVDDKFEPAGDFEPVTEAPAKEGLGLWQDLLSKAKAAGFGAGQGALAGFADELAGVGGAVGEKAMAALGQAPDRPFGDMYREARNFARNEYDAAKQQEPWSYGLGNVAGALGQVGGLGSVGIKLAARGKQAVAQGAGLGALTGIGGSNADLTKGEVGGAALDTGVGAGLGAAAGKIAPIVTDKIGAALKNPIAKSKEALGGAMQAPQKAYERVAERVGKWGMAQKSTPASDVGGVLASARVKALRQVADTAELGSEMARTLRRAQESLGGTGGKLLEVMSPEEKQLVAQGMAELLQARGLTDVTPEFVAQNMDDLARAAGSELTDLTGNQFLRLANKRDAQWWVRAGEGVRKFWGSKLMAGEQLDPRLVEEMALNREVADSFAKGELDRMGRPFVEGGKPGKYQFRVADVHGKLSGAEQEAAKQRVLREDLARKELMPTNPAIRVGGGNAPPVAEPGQGPNVSSMFERQQKRLEFQRSPEGRKHFADMIASVNDNVRARGTNPATAGFDLEAWGSQWEGARAREALRNLATGRNFLEQRALPIAGALAGGGGGASLGMLGALSGSTLGLGAASKAPVVADALGEVGQSLSASGRDDLARSAMKMATDPFKLRRLADLPGVVGNGARWALQVAEDPAAFSARTYVLSQRPDFRKAIAGDDAEQ